MTETETKEFYELKAWVETIAALTDQLIKRVDKLEAKSEK